MLKTSFLATLTDPVEVAIAPSTIDALVTFLELAGDDRHRIAFDRLDVDAFVAAERVREQPDEHRASRAAQHFRVLAAFFRWLASEEWMEAHPAERIAIRLSVAARELEGREER